MATALGALERKGHDHPETHLALLRSWDTALLLVKHSSLSASEISAIKAFAADRSFDLAYLPGLQASEANTNNVLPEPIFYEGAHALVGPARESFLKRYKFDLTPATDDRPYFFDFFKWQSLPELLKLRAVGCGALLDWGLSDPGRHLVSGDHTQPRSDPSAVTAWAEKQRADIRALVGCLLLRHDGTRVSVRRDGLLAMSFGFSIVVLLTAALYIHGAAVFFRCAGICGPAQTGSADVFPGG